MSEVVPDAPAAVAGVMGQDINHEREQLSPVDSVPALTLAFSTRQAGDVVTLGIVRGTRTLSLQVMVIERPHELDQISDLSDATKNAVRRHRDRRRCRHRRY